MQENWYTPLRDIVSLGSQKTKIKHMGELANQRREHLGQFFTPDHVAAFMWRIVSEHKFNSIFDNSIGSGRLVQFADPAKHSIYGVDVHEETVSRVKEIVKGAGFTCKISHAGMEDIRVSSMDVSLINPPFSIHLESPLLSSYHGCTRMGKYGPNSSAMSEEYALHQALEASKVVVALLPTPTALQFLNATWSGRSRLRAIFHLPRNTFAVENANVATSVMVFGEYRYRDAVLEHTLTNWSEDLPELGLGVALKETYSKPSMRRRILDATEPTIVIPVTGDSRVKVDLDGRHVKLRYFCGFTQARVANAILRKRIYSSDGHRLPKGVQYSGQGILDLEVHLIQPDPIKSFRTLIEIISNNGGTPIVAEMIFNALRKRHAKSRRQQMPMSHTIWSRGASCQQRL